MYTYEERVAAAVLLSLKIISFSRDRLHHYCDYAYYVEYAFYVDYAFYADYAFSKAKKNILVKN